MRKAIRGSKRASESCSPENLLLSLATVAPGPPPRPEKKQRHEAPLSPKVVKPGPKSPIKAGVFECTLERPTAPVRLCEGRRGMP